MKKEKIQPNLLVAILPPDGKSGKAFLLGITLGKAKKRPEIWAVRYGYHSGLTTIDIPAKKLLPIKLLSVEELLSEAVPGGFKEIHPDRAFQKYFQEIKPRLSEICDQLDLELIAQRVFVFDPIREEELKTLPCSK